MTSNLEHRWALVVIALIISVYAFVQPEYASYAASSQLACTALFLYGICSGISLLCIEPRVILFLRSYTSQANKEAESAARGLCLVLIITYSFFPAAAFVAWKAENTGELWLAVVGFLVLHVVFGSILFPLRKALVNSKQLSARINQL